MTQTWGFFSPFTTVHVKWFSEENVKMPPLNTIVNSSFISITVLFALGIIILPWLHSKLHHIKIGHCLFVRLENYKIYFFPFIKYSFVVILIVQMTSGWLFAPELTIQHYLVSFFVGISIICFLFSFTFMVKVGAFIIFSLFVMMGIQYGVGHMIDYFFYLAILFVLIMKNTKWEKWNMHILYLMTGLSLSWVAVEKLMYPQVVEELAVENQIPMLGLSPRTFSYLSAFIEFLAGYLLIIGLFPRFLSLFLTLLFIITSTVFGYVEVKGHLMIHFILILFMIDGNSTYSSPIFYYRHLSPQMLWISLCFFGLLIAFIFIFHSVV